MRYIYVVIAESTDVGDCDGILGISTNLKRALSWAKEYQHKKKLKTHRRVYQSARIDRYIPNASIEECVSIEVWWERIKGEWVFKHRIEEE